MGIKSFDVASFSTASLVDPREVGFQDSIDIIIDELHRTRKSFVKIGWYLKHINETEMYKEYGYANIYEVAYDKFHISQSTTTRFINLCVEFSINHDSPELDEKYVDFNVSQLFEMLPMNQDEKNKISPEMTVKQIREAKKEAKITKNTNDTVSNNTIQDNADIPGQTSIEKDFPEYMPNKDENPKLELSDTAVQEKIKYATSHKEDEVLPVEEFIDIECRELEEEDACCDTFSRNSCKSEELLKIRRILDEKKEELDDWLKVAAEENVPESTLFEKKIIVAALASMVCDLEEAVDFAGRGKITGIYSAKRMDNGETVEGNLIYMQSAFAYILTKENYNKMIINDESETEHCQLIRVMERSIRQVTEGDVI
ncbi:MAG: hypothetical protein LUI12_09940 [Clostridiales bacterium]|nr:hypothetical protein [Clostridiales bacterium]